MSFEVTGSITPPSSFRTPKPLAASTGEVLGLTPIERPDYDFEGAWFQCGDIEFHLIVAEEHLAPSRRHLALAVDDFDACLDQLRQNGVRARGRTRHETPQRPVVRFLQGPGREPDRDHGTSYLTT